MDKRTQKAIQGENATTIIAEGKVDHTNLDKAQNAFKGFIVRIPLLPPPTTTVC